MIRHLKHTDIDKKKWDLCIKDSFNGIVYAYSWYLDTVCKNWEALVEDDYTRVMPLTLGKKLGITYLYQPFFTQQLGVFSVPKLTEQKTHEFFTNIPEKVKYIDVCLNTFSKFSLKDYTAKKQITHELDLILDYDSLRKNYSDSVLKNLKKASKFNLEIDKKVSPKNLITIFKNNKGKDVKNVADEDYAMLEKLIDKCIAKNRAKVWGVKSDDNKLQGGAVFVYENGKIIYLLSCSTAQGKEMVITPFMMDAFIKEHSQQNLILDFEGSNIPDLARFFKRFGAKECIYLRVRKNNLPKVLKWLKK